MPDPSETPEGPRGEAERLIGWTGERMVPWAPDYQVVYEHLHRYLIASRYVDGARVLDLASGEGYGSALLAAAAKEVVGVDIDPVAVRHAHGRYQQPNLRFEVGSIVDAEVLPDAAELFDVVVCFEALEHVDDHEGLVANVRRLLRPGGLFVVSTPDRRVYSDEPGQDNPFHTHELDRQELADLLRARFANVRMAGQSVVAGSVLADLGPGGGEPLVHTLAPDAGEALGWRIDPGFTPVYLIALASDGPLPSPPSVSVVLDADLSAVRVAERRAGRAEDVAVRAAAELAELQSALAVRVLHRYRGVVERVFPAGTARRGRYASLLRGARQAVTAGRARHQKDAGEAYPPAVEAPQVMGPGFPEPPISLPTFDDPRLSVVIPVHGEWAVTEQCLRALPAAISVPFEVVVVDDASPDRSRAQLAQTEGVRVVALDDNVGFVGACNRGIAAARGEFVLLLHNDTVPDPGSLDRLVDVLAGDPEVGVVGAELVSPDGRLQAAGGIVWRDGSAHNVGRGGDPDAPEHSFPRDVDYCSGAALAVRRSLLERIGGLDERFSPASYEDADLCFSARAAGLRVVYEPKARVMHQEGVAHGTDESRGIERYQGVNREAFAAKWAGALAQQYSPGTPISLAKTRPPRGRVFIADHILPEFDRDGGSLRMYRIVGLLRSLGHAVTFLGRDRALPQPYTQALLDLGVEVVGPRTDVPNLLRELASELDAIVLSRRTVAWSLLEAVKEAAPLVPVVFDTVDLHFVREAAEARSGAGDAVERARTGKERELALMRIADAVWVVSHTERDLVRELVPDVRVDVVPTVHEADPTPAPFAARAGLLFVSNWQHTPNVDGVLWFFDEILSLVRERLGDVAVHLVGPHLPDHVAARADAHTSVHGWVPDLTPIYEQVRLAIAPLRYGAGMKSKVAEALEHGVPVVTTSVGVDGMAPAVCSHILVADDAAAFANALVSLYDDEARWDQLRRDGPVAVAAAYGGDAVRANLEHALAGLAERRVWP